MIGVVIVTNLEHLEKSIALSIVDSTIKLKNIEAIIVLMSAGNGLDQ